MMRHRHGPGGVGRGGMSRTAEDGRAAARHRGFTLIELLIAITLTGIILVLLFSALRLGSRSWDVAEEHAQSSTDVRLVETLVRRTLRQARAVTWQVANQVPAVRVAFAGKAQSLRFVAPLPAQLAQGGLHVMDLVLEKDGAGEQRLVLSWQRFEREAPEPSASPAETDQVVLVAGIDAGSFAYFGAEQPDGDPAWVDHWEDPVRLPLLVRMEIQRRGQDWPPLVAELPR